MSENIAQASGWLRIRESSWIAAGSERIMVIWSEAEKEESEDVFGEIMPKVISMPVETLRASQRSGEKWLA